MRDTVRKKSMKGENMEVERKKRMRGKKVRKENARERERM